MAYPAGFAGQKFQPEVLDKLVEARKLYPLVEIGLDGGVTEKNAKKILQAGFDTVNINSALFGAEDTLSRYFEFLGYLL
jgi:ribulose-phosphate 3-epimerase